MANFMQMMQKAQGFKAKLQELQARAQLRETDGEAGNGLVRCRVNGKFELKMLKIDPSLINPAEADVLEDMIIVAVNSARGKAEQELADETRAMMKDMGLPPGFDLPI